MPQKKEIVYPFFLECCTFATDPFWENVFEDLAYAKPPQGVYISKNFLCCAYKGKEFTYKIERKDPQVLYNDIYNLLTGKLLLLSCKELHHKKQKFYEIEKGLQEEYQEWSDIRKKTIRDVMIEQYTISMSKKHNLSLKLSKFLLAMIIVSLMFKTISSRDIVFADGKIEHIKGFLFEDGNVICQRPICQTNIPVTEERIEDHHMITICSLWPKYIEQFRLYM
jgi:hypothetical protein